MNLVAIALLLVLIAIGLLVFWSLTKKRVDSTPPPSQSLLTAPPVLLYGFSTEATGRTIASSTGALTLTVDGLITTPIADDRTSSEWIIVTRAGGVSLKNSVTGRWISGTSTTEEESAATVFTIVGPKRDGKIHEFANDLGYLATDIDGKVIYTDSPELSSEWIVVFAT